MCLLYAGYFVGMEQTLKMASLKGFVRLYVYGVSPVNTSSRPLPASPEAMQDKSPEGRLRGHSRRLAKDPVSSCGAAEQGPGLTPGFIPLIEEVRVVDNVM